MKTSELQGAALDWAVAKCEGRDQFFSLNQPTHKEHCFSLMAYSTDWAQGGLIIEREGINLRALSGALWEAETWSAGGGQYLLDGPTPLTAAMRCYVASKLGDEVEVPDGLVT